MRRLKRKQRIRAHRIAAAASAHLTVVIVGIIGIELIDDVHLSRRVVRVLEMTTKELRAGKSLAAQVTIEARLDSKVADRLRLHSSVNIVNMARQMVLLRE